MKIINMFKNEKVLTAPLNEFQKRAKEKQKIELSKTPTRTDVINFLLTKTDNKNYLEIGTRNPDDNFNKVNADFKKSVDPCIEFDTEDIDFKLTSDDFFKQYSSIELIKNIKWDVIFIDGLHLAEQVFRDIVNSLDVLATNGFIVLHDCNPPSEYHARENYYDHSTVAGGCWNGTVWKAFLKARNMNSLYTACVDTDWGIGILSLKPKKHFNNIADGTYTNEFYEYEILNKERKNMLNLITVEELFAI